jgi:hypothetical protein
MRKQLAETKAMGTRKEEEKAAQTPNPAAEKGAGKKKTEEKKDD